MLAEQAQGQRQIAETAASRLQQIRQLESVMRDLPPLDIPVEHTFGPHFYARTIRVPAGATLVGKVHASEHVFLLSKGELLVATEDGEQHLRAPAQFVCRPGLKRAGHALTDCVVTNVHITDETDLERLESELIVSEALPAPDAPMALED